MYPDSTSSPHMATGIPVASAAAAPGNLRSQPPSSSLPWSTGLCGCFSDMRNCCLTCCCPYITFGQIAEILDQGSMTCATSAILYGVVAHFTGHPCLYSSMYRTKLRQQYRLQERPCNDCLVHWCCECCALCQEYRELQHQGFDMLIGWPGNIERQNPGVVAMTSIAPKVESGMTR